MLDLKAAAAYEGLSASQAVDLVVFVVIYLFYAILSVVLLLTKPEPRRVPWLHLSVCVARRYRVVKVVKLFEVGVVDSRSRLTRA